MNFSKLDLSLNKLNGTLIDSYQLPSYVDIIDKQSSYLNVSVNRLSGNLPSSIRHTNMTVDLVNGNLFGCPKLLNDIAYTNKGADVDCGSNNFAEPLYVWLCLIVTGLVSIVVLFRYCNRGYTLRVKHAIFDWWNTSYQYVESSVVGTSEVSIVSNSKMYHTVKTIARVEQVCSMSILLSSYFVAVVMICYIILKVYSKTYLNSMYQVQYLYTTTAAYLIGLSPSIVIWILVTASGLIVVMLCIVSRTSDVKVVVNSERSDIRRIKSDNIDVAEIYQERLRVWSIQLLVSILLMGVAFGINYGFVRIVYFESTGNLGAINFVFGLLKFILSSFVVPYSSSIFRKSSRTVYVVTMTVGVNIIAPGIAVLMKSPLCLYYYLSPRYITDTYNISQLSNENGHGGFQSTPVSSQFQPTWIYSYQCSSSFLSAYLPNIIYLNIFSGIVSPVVNLILMILYAGKYNSTIEKVKYYLKFLVKTKVTESDVQVYDIFNTSTDNDVLQIEMSVQSNHSSSSIDVNENTIKQKDTNDSRITSKSTLDSNSNEAYDINVLGHMSNICVDVTYLLTFGCASPLLAVLMSCSIVTNILIWRLIIGRYIFIVSKVIGLQGCKDRLETAFSDLWRSLSDTWWIISILVGIFWALFIFDMIGDSNNTGGIIGAVLMFIWCPLVFISFHKFLEVADTSINTNSYRYRISIYIENITLSIHKFIWKCILPYHGNNNSNSNSNSNDSVRVSTIQEAVSPLAGATSLLYNNKTSSINSNTNSSK